MTSNTAPLTPRARASRAPALAVGLAILGVFGASGIPGLAPAPAHAKAERVVGYTFEQVWPAAIRFLRVDEGHRIVERDGEAGYILFEVGEVKENKTFRAALEVVRIEDSRGRPALRLVVRIEDRPAYMEHGLLDRLERKLRDQLGDPKRPPAKPETRPENQPDAKTERQPESQLEARPEVRSKRQPERQPERQPDARSAT